MVRLGIHCYVKTCSEQITIMERKLNISSMCVPLRVLHFMKTYRADMYRLFKKYFNQIING